MHKWVKVGTLLITLSLLTAVPAQTEGDQRVFNLAMSPISSAARVYRNLTEIELYRDVVPRTDDTVEVEVRGFTDSPAMDVPVPEYQVQSNEVNKVMVPDIPVQGYDLRPDRSCPQIRTSLNFSYIMGRGIDLDQCLRKNMYFQLLYPLYDASKYADNESMVRMVESTENIEVQQNESASITSVARIFNEDSKFYVSVNYFFSMSFMFVKGSKYVGYWVRTLLSVNRTELFEGIFQYYKFPTLYVDYGMIEEVVYDTETNWVVLYKSDLWMETLFANRTFSPPIGELRGFARNFTFVDPSYGIESIAELTKMLELNPPVTTMEDLHLRYWATSTTERVDQPSLPDYVLAIPPMILGIMLITYLIRRRRRRLKKVWRVLYPES